MTKIIFYKNQESIFGFEASGHSGYADAGADIVCSSISSLTQMTIVGIENVLNINCNFKQDDKNAKIYLKLPKNISSALLEKSQYFFEALLISLKKIEKQYKKFIKVEVKDEIF